MKRKKNEYRHLFLQICSVAPLRRVEMKITPIRKLRKANERGKQERKRYKQIFDRVWYTHKSKRQTSKKKYKIHILISRIWFTFLCCNRHQSRNENKLLAFPYNLIMPILKSYKFNFSLSWSIRTPFFNTDPVRCFRLFSFNIKFFISLF